MSKRSLDPEATEAARFVDKRSRVNIDRSVERYGTDMTLLRAECLERDGYQCVLCGNHQDWLEMDHIVPRGSNGVDRNDVLSNVRILCYGCHRKVHVRIKFGVA